MTTAQERLQVMIDAAMERAGVAAREETEEPEEPTNVKEELQDGEAELAVPCEVYSRIVGYLRPVGNWNKAKQLEFEERATFRVPGEDDNAGD